MAVLSPVAKQQFFTDAGQQAAGYKLYTYAANTTTPQATYTNRAGTVANANPIVLDTQGRATIYLDPALTYDYVLKTASDVPVWTQEDVVAGGANSADVSFLQAGTGAVARTMQDKGRELLTPEDKGAVGDGATSDTTAMTNAFSTANAGRVLTLLGDKSYYLDSWTAVEPGSRGLRIDGKGATITTDASGVTLITPSGDVGLTDVELVGFASGIGAVSSDDAAGRIVVDNVRFANLTAPAVSVKNQFERVEVWGSKVDGAVGRAFAAGADDGSQATQKSALFIGNQALDIANAGSSQTIPYLSYAGRSVMAYNMLDGFGDAAATGEADGYYSKSPYSLMVGNFASGLETTSLSKYFFNLKGSERGAGGVNPQYGYGSVAAFNVAQGDGLGTGLQLQPGECSAVFNFFDNVAIGVEIGSTTSDKNGVIGNIVVGSGTGRGVSASTGATDGQVVFGLNRFANVSGGIRFTATDTVTSGLISVADQLKGATGSGYGFEFNGTTGDYNLKSVAIIHPTIDSFEGPPIRLTNVDGAVIDTPRVLNADSGDTTTQVSLSEVRNLIVRDLHRTFTASGTTSATLLSQSIPSGAVATVTGTICGKNADGDVAFAYEVRGKVWHDGTSVRKIVTETIEGGAVDNAGSSVSMTGISLVVSGSTFSIRCALGAGEEWSGFATLSYKMN
jgi:hypothetical protein